MLLAAPLHAQNFNSGSDGSDGALNVTQSTTLDVPPDGIFNFTTVTVNPGQVLSFRRNALNTPVFILATGDINVVSGCIVSVEGTNGTSNPPAGGAGGPGGFDGGQPGFENIPPGAGGGPGGGAGGDISVPGVSPASAGAAAYGGATSQPSTSDGAVYGSALLVPLVGGSGGGGALGSSSGPGIGGSGGGGAILLASNTRIQMDGDIRARGGSNGFPHTGQGSGGAIRVVAPTVSGAGIFRVSGGSGGVNTSNGDQGGNGRVRIDTIDRTGIRFSIDVGQQAESVGSFMAVFPPVVPRLDIVEVAGRAIAAGTPVDILLPFGTSPNQSVKVRARDFVGTVPIEVVLVPDSGPRQVIQTQISMTTNPADATVNVTFPVNNRTRVGAWTR